MSSVIRDFVESTIPRTRAFEYYKLDNQCCIVVSDIYTQLFNHNISNQVDPEVRKRFLKHSLTIKDYFLITSGGLTPTIEKYEKELEKCVDDARVRIEGHPRVHVLMFSTLVEQLHTLIPSGKESLSDEQLDNISLQLQREKMFQHSSFTHICDLKLEKILCSVEIKQNHLNRFSEWVNLKGLSVSLDLLKTFKHDVTVDFNEKVKELIEMIDEVKSRICKMNCKSNQCKKLLELFLADRIMFRQVTKTMATSSDFDDEDKALFNSYTRLHEVRDILSSLPKDLEMFRQVQKSLADEEKLSEEFKPLTVAMDHIVKYLDQLSLYSNEMKQQDDDNVLSLIRTYIADEYELAQQSVKELSNVSNTLQDEVVTLKENSKKVSDISSIREDAVSKSQRSLSKYEQELNKQYLELNEKYTAIFQSAAVTADNVMIEFENDLAKLKEEFNKAFVKLVYDTQTKIIRIGEDVKSKQIEMNRDTELIKSLNVEKYDVQRKAIISQFKESVSEKQQTRISELENDRLRLIHRIEKSMKKLNSAKQFTGLFESYQINIPLLKRMFKDYDISMTKEDNFLSEMDTRITEKWKTVILHHYDASIDQAMQLVKKQLDEVKDTVIVQEEQRAEVKEPELKDYEVTNISIENLSANSAASEAQKKSEKLFDHMKAPKLVTEVLYK